jgi:hypothetical protein
MLGIEIINAGKFLHLDPNTKIKISLRNGAYLGNSTDYNADVIPTAFSFPTEISLNRHNAALLRHPQQINNAQNFLIDEPIRIWVKGTVLFYGALSVREIKGNRCSFDITVNTINALKSKPLNTLDLGNIDGGVVNVFTRAIETINEPDTHGYIFAPVWNNDFYTPSGEKKYINSEYQNAWTSAPFGTGAVVNSGGGAMTAHPKLSHVLQKMFENEGFAFDNQFQTNRELQWLLVHSNASLCTPTGNFNIPIMQIARGLPKMSAGEFLRHICRKFALSPSVNFFTKTVKLVPFSTIFSSTDSVDWTNIALINPSLKDDRAYPSVFKDKITSGIIPDYSGMPRFNGAPTNPSSPEGIYENGGSTVYFNPNPTDPPQKYRVNLAPSVPTGGTASEYENGTGYCPQVAAKFGSNDARVAGVAQKGTYNTDTAAQESDNAARLFFYRGIFGASGTTASPVTSSEATDVNNNNTRIGWEVTGQTTTLPQYAFTPYDAAYSLEWSGAKGLFKKFWEGNYEFVKTAKTVTIPIAPSFKQLLAFDFERKITIRNMIYLAKRLDFVIDSAGNISGCEVELLTTV